MTYVPHYEIYVAVFSTSLDFGPLGGMDKVAQITPEQTEQASRVCGDELLAVYGDQAGAVCSLHTCYHNDEGTSHRPCTTEVLWQNA